MRVWGGLLGLHSAAQVDLVRHRSARQAQDRNFEACFERCRCAVRNIAKVDPAYAVAAHKELQDLSAAPA